MTAPQRTLYVSDLDGTLLNAQSQVSETTATILNDLIENRGALFTVATARTPATVVSLMNNVHTRLPLIVMAGAAMWDNSRHCYANVNAISEEYVGTLLQIFRDCDVSPFVYRRDGNKIVAYHDAPLSPDEEHFVSQRCDTPLKTFHLQAGSGNSQNEIMLIFSMGNYSKLYRAYQQIQASTPCAAVCYHDIFNYEDGILEVYAPGSSKAQAILTLAKKVNADRIVVFGDNLNDLPMMQIADVSIAVENAFPEVRCAATEIIGPNTSDSVAHRIAKEF